MSTTVIHTTPRVLSVEALEEYRLVVHFEDGVKGIVALENRLFGPMFEPLRDPAFFDSVSIDSFGVPCWPNGADIAPDTLYEMLQEID